MWFPLSFIVFQCALHGFNLRCDVAADNQVKAGQLRVMEAFLEVLSLHKANAEVARRVAGAMSKICKIGILSELYIIDSGLVILRV